MDQLPDELIQYILKIIVEPSVEYSYKLLTEPFWRNIHLDLSYNYRFDIDDYVNAKCGFYPFEVHASSTASQTREVFGNTWSQNESHPLYFVSMASHRIRQMTLPLLLDSMDIILYGEGSEDDEVKLLQNLLRKGARLSRLARNVRILSHSTYPRKITAEHYYQVVTQVLRMCPKLKRLYLPFAEEQWTPLFPVIHEINSYPCPDLQLVFPVAFGHAKDIDFDDPGLKLDMLPCLSRVICWWYYFSDNVTPDYEDYLYKLVTKLGLNVAEIDGLAPGWEKRTYPGLLSVEACRHLNTPVEAEPSESIAEFLSRHPLLQRVCLEKYPHDKTPWGIKLLEEMKPHKCTLPSYSQCIATPSDSNHQHSSTNHEWEIIVAKVCLKINQHSSIAHAMSMLGKALPEIVSLHLDFDENCTRDVEKFDMKNLIPLFAQAFRNLRHLAFPASVFRSLTREWCDETGQLFEYESGAYDRSGGLARPYRVACQTFFTKLIRAMQTLRIVRFCTSRTPSDKAARFLEFDKVRESGEVRISYRVGHVSDWYTGHEF
ncbi:hypothetical protein VKT23_007604 [Stygiomarasmius scandens]|uniref:F-box domain-containing protein n=1 Tax=Marasmiellus scandens TaxID=2682957 RepID=A0ABR1JNK3_9AGAR